MWSKGSRWTVAAALVAASVCGSAEAALVAYWALDETSGAIAYDSSGNDFNGNIIGNVQFVTGGKMGGAYQFDGTDDHVAVDHNPTLFIAGALTLSVWVKPASLSYPNDLNMAILRARDCNSYSTPYDIEAKTNGRFNFAYTFESGTWLNHEFGSVSVGEWTHVAVTCNADRSAITTYVNGVQTSTTSGEVAMLETDSWMLRPLHIGASLDDELQPWHCGDFNGEIDEIHIFDEEFSTEAIQDLASGLGSFELLSPSGGAGDLELSPSFDWEDSVNATSYTLTVSISADLASPVVNEAGITTRPHPLSVSLDDDTLYYWSVTATDGTNSRSCEAVFSFRTAKHFDLLSPADQEQNVPLLPGFDWEDHAGTDTYTLLVSVNSDLASPVATIADIGTSDYDYTLADPALTEDTVYWWGVTAHTAGGDVDCSQNLSFRTGVRPGTFSLVSPGTGELDQEVTVTLSWSESADADEYVLVVTGPSAQEYIRTTVADVDGTTQYDYAVAFGELDYSTDYTWTVTALNGVGERSVSDTFSTKDDNDPPEVSSTSPADGSDDVEAEKSIRITFNEDMGQVTVTVLAEDTIDPVIGTESLTGGTFTFDPTDELAEGVTYTVTIDGTQTWDSVASPGNLLDPDGTGPLAAGDDYVFTFTTAEALTGLASGQGCNPGVASGAPRCLAFAAAVAVGLLISTKARVAVGGGRGER